MGLLNKKPPEAAMDEGLATLAKRRVNAAERVDAAIVEMEAAIDGLIDADRLFFDEVRRAGHRDQGTAGHLRRVLRTLLMGQMQVAAPGLIKVLGLPYLPASARGSIAASVRRTSNNDLANFTPEKEAAQ